MKTSLTEDISLTKDIYLTEDISLTEDIYLTEDISLTADIDTAFHMFSHTSSAYPPLPPHTLMSKV